MLSQIYTRLLIALLMLLPTTNTYAIDAFGLGVGHGNENADHYGVSARWNWDEHLLNGESWLVRGAWEAEASFWDGNAGITGNSSLGEIGIKPVLRLESKSKIFNSRPFFEAAIGISLLTESKLGNRDFASSYQTGYHIGVGTRVGSKSRYEIGYRFQHHSNAGMASPNPGINFHLLRFAYNYD